jgi:RNA polymerase sigma factor (sigma-70 family)
MHTPLCPVRTAATRRPRPPAFASCAPEAGGSTWLPGVPPPPTGYSQPGHSRRPRCSGKPEAARGRVLPDESQEQPLSEWARGLSQDQWRKLVKHASLERGTPCAVDGEDLVQAFLVRVLRGDFDHRSVPPAKTMAFAKAVLRFHPRKAALARGLYDFERLADTLPDSGATPGVQFERTELRRLLGRAMRRLSKTLRQAVIRRDLQGRSVVEMAGLEGASSDVIRQRLARGRQKARQVLGLQDPTRQ